MALFEQVLPALREGQKARRRPWRSTNSFITRNSSVTVEQALADDWEVVEPPPPTEAEMLDFVLGSGRYWDAYGYMHNRADVIAAMRKAGATK